MEQERIEMLLAEVIAGERSEHDPEVAAALQADPELGAVLERRRSLAQQLAGVGEDLQRGPASTDHDLHGDAIVRREVEAFAEQRKGGNGATIHWGWFGVAAAAAVAAAVLVLMFATGGQSDPAIGQGQGTRYLPSGPELQPLAAAREVKVGEATTWDLSRVGFDADDAIQIDFHMNPDAMFSDDQGVVSIPLDSNRTWTSPPDFFSATDSSTATLKLYHRIDRELKLVGEQSLQLLR